jgi:hypothetical protein
MKPSANSQIMSEEISDRNLERVTSVIKNMKALLENLSQKTSQLPKVDDKGNSECPYAEDLYAEQEEAITKVAEELKRLRRYQEIVDQLVAKHRRNLDLIRTDASSLHLDRAKEQYSSAELSQEHNYRQAVRCQKELLEIISWAENAIALARGKKFPGGKPEKKFRPPSGFASGLSASGSAGYSGPASPAGASFTPSLKTEIDSLMSLGPLGGKP